MQENRAESENKRRNEFLIMDGGTTIKTVGKV